MALIRHIPDAELVQLKQSGLSHAQVAIRLGVSKATIKRRWRKIADAKNPAVLAFARQLEAIRETAPTDFCREELSRLINDLRLRHAVSRDVKKQRILEALHTGARELEEIADECRLLRSEADDLLSELIAEGQVYKRARGGALNRGRRQKFHFVPAGEPTKN